MRTEDRLDRMLDDALEMTFPASDPIAVYVREADSAVDENQEETPSFPLAA